MMMTAYNNDHLPLLFTFSFLSSLLAIVSLISSVGHCRHRRFLLFPRTVYLFTSSRLVGASSGRMKRRMCASMAHDRNRKKNIAEKLSVCVYFDALLCHYAMDWLNYCVCVKLSICIILLSPATVLKWTRVEKWFKSVIVDDSSLNSITRPSVCLELVVVAML